MCFAPLPKVVRTVHFYFQMCLAPQRRALFPQFNFQKSSEHDILRHLLIEHVLRATTGCTFSTSQLPNVVREWCALTLLTSKCASRHNGGQFFVSHLPRCLRTRRFSKPPLRLSGATKHWKKTVLRDLFAHLHLLSSDVLHLLSSLLTFSTSEFLPGCDISISPVNFILINYFTYNM